MNSFFLGTNWKMHKTADEAAEYIQKLDGFAREFPEFTAFLIPPYTALWRMRSYIDEHQAPFLLGAQNVHEEAEGAYTGEISLPMLQEIGVDLVEIGHSERRQYYNETDFSVNRKARRTVDAGLTALICIGENAQEKAVGVSAEKIRLQLKTALYGIEVDSVSRIWIAYEPVWAIGDQGIPAEGGYVAEIHACIREGLIAQFGAQGREVPVLYGGSVHADNCTAYLNDPNINGLFIGRSAWQADRFYEIMQIVRRARS